MSRIICNVNGSGSADAYPLEKAAFEKEGAELIIRKSLTPDELEQNARDAEIILFTATKFDDAAFDRLPNLKLLVRYGIGYDTVDLEAAKRHGVMLCNSPTYGCYDVAEHAFALLQTVNRRISVYDRGRRGEAVGETGNYPCRRLEGKQLGIVGYGRIGRYVARFSTGFGMKIAAYDPYCDFEKAEPKAVSMSLEELLSTSDFVSLNTVLNDETRGMMNADRFALMKPDAVLINTSRGGLVDEDALYDALSNRRIRGAGIDVWNAIPDKNSRFARLDNIVMTPHVAWNTVEAAAALKQEVITTVTRYLHGETLTNRIV